MKRNVLSALLAAWLVWSGTVGAADFMFRARVDGKMLEGKPLSWSADQMLLLGRDGQLYRFNPKKAKESQKTSPRFFGYSPSEMKVQLQKEFGKQFEVTETRHYLVVHSQGERDEWANRFEDLYKRFEHYFRVRGFKLEEPPYPLVAVVFRNEADYRRHAEASGTPVPPRWLGHYSPISNRIFLFDSTTGDAAHWSTNADTIIHEATHQTAYNSGVHRRFSGTPRWVSEGLATMFEARGVWSSQYDNTQADRINRGRHFGFKDLVSNRWKPGMVVNLISSDRMFQSDEADAYALAWAMSFYLCETQPRLYGQYLAKTAERPMFGGYAAAERVADFEDIFGSEWKMFEMKFLRYMAEVK
ncbi:MAG: DUF1570 domain-containing protein [Pirellulales bacterium]